MITRRARSLPIVLGLVLSLVQSTCPSTNAANERARVLSIHGTFRLHHPFGLALDRQGQHVYVADSLNNRIVEMAPSGQELRSWGHYGSAPGSFDQPGAVAVGLHGWVYVIDYGNNRVERFSHDGRLLGMWGSFGTVPGRFAAPNDLAADAQGNVYVADTANCRIQEFTATGQFVHTWTLQALHAGVLPSPTAVAVTAQGNIFATVIEARVDRYGNLVEAANAAHSLEEISVSTQNVTVWGDKGSGPGQFHDPDGVATDDRGSVYIADFGNNRVQELTENGRYLRSWGPGIAPGLRFHGPMRVTLDHHGTLYILDWYNSRIVTVPVSNASSPNRPRRLE